MIFLSLTAKSQAVGLSMSKIKASPQYLPFKKGKLSIKSSFSIDNQQVVKNKPRPIPSVFSVETLPFFCKADRQVQPR